MMKLEKALDIVGHKGYGYPENEAREAYEIVLQAATKSKAEPIKAEHGLTMVIYFVCPDCNQTVYEGMNFCFHCGKKLDWSRWGTINDFGNMQDKEEGMI